ncbi:RNA-metabolising metallo-beta-lactamase family protein [Agrilactobacillus composti DSM 18527 = JCM 14202]|uniref:Ribonuclease J n=1 Tax=Agrilactobacillus composti DSM 18527 = JCM 14202 TaxID=1423734 RepID=X0PNE6_9LACO|nr:ribonuclease J [Agrilactobacillus composti]KRM36593.1 RNA-metabolising metallo-beta-lactamase family protein [Agrilactobacillus composti DSM 18527 = JCM 14202]GAF39082.1 Zn-dependent hydrolase [Agrilactobacillus composti DSM 18527 = JCM 14202]
MSQNIKVIPLGGLRENGKNMYAVEVDDEIFILDCGLKYPENELLGIDVVIPDFSYLEENIDKIVGVFLTHGHADAIGALPYFLKSRDIPVFGSKLTIELAKINTERDPLSKKFNDFHVVDEKTAIDFENATVSFFKTTHSIPGSFGISIKTELGNIVYTGDFKFDQSATPMYQTDFARLTQIGAQGVILLLSDSANAESARPSVNELEIGRYVEETFKYHNGRIIVASVASNIARIQQVFDAAYRTGRKVVLTGRDLERIIRTAMRLDYLKIESDDILVPIKDMAKYDDDQLVILETGRMGEPLKALQKMAQKRNRSIHIHENDLVFITTTPSYAMETNVARTKDMIYRAGGEVKSISDDLHASGHANKNELQLMINLLNPKYLMPIQGEYRLMDAHAEIAHETGLPFKNIFLAQNGDVLSVEAEGVHLGTAVDSGNVMIDGSGVGDIGNIVLRDRKVLSEDGIFVAVVTIDRKNKKIVAKPKVITRGFVYIKANRDLMAESIDIVANTIQNNLDHKEFDWSTLKQDLREDLGHFLYEQTHRHPVILPVIMEINQNKLRSQSRKHPTNTSN